MVRSMTQKMLLLQELLSLLISRTFMNHSVEDLIDQEIVTQIMNFGLLMMADTEKINAS
jgi:hypothetical protein